MGLPAEFVVSMPLGWSSTAPALRDLSSQFSETAGRQVISAGLICHGALPFWCGALWRT
jgi:hypothetical protein